MPWGIMCRSVSTFDAYVLSESSLFVYDQLLVAKTCGTTCLLRACPVFLRLARERGLEPLRCWYSRPSFLFPENQPMPHSCFNHEVSHLDALFGDLPGGSCAFRLGNRLSGFQWHVYAADARPSHSSTCSSDHSLTLEVCMTGLERDAAKHFYNEDGSASVERTAKESGLTHLFPGAELDGIVFSPCGYSLNAVHTRRFLTVHITPEEGCSYASVELGGPGRGHDSPAHLISLVLSIFKPERAGIALSGDASSEGLDAWESRSLPSFPGYYRSQLSRQTLSCGGFVHFATLEKEGALKECQRSGKVDAEAEGESRSQSIHAPPTPPQRNAPADKSQEVDSGLAKESEAPPKCMRRDEGEAALLKVGTTFGAHVAEQAESLIKESKDEELVYVVDLGSVLQAWREWRRLLPGVRPYYAVKANSDPALLNLLAELGAGFECASYAEVEAALSAGADPARMLYGHPAKPASQASKVGRRVHQGLTVVDTPEEVEKVASLLPGYTILLRIDAKDPGARCPLWNKFGAAESEWERILEVAQSCGARLGGVCFHIGSACSTDSCGFAFDSACRSARRALNAIRCAGFSPPPGCQGYVVDVGGGIPGDAEGSAFAASGLMQQVEKHFSDCSPVEVIAEPGRFFAQNAVSTFSRVIGRRDGKKPSYYLLDGVYGSFNCLLYDHASCPSPVALRPGNPNAFDGCALMPSTIFGPTCDGIDVLMENHPLPPLQRGDWLGFHRMGAYTLSAASSFNGFSAQRDGSVKYLMPQR